jgi:adenylyltransferase/sulfurtransferase
MKIKIKLLKPFSDIAGKGDVDLEIQGKNVAVALNELCQQFPKLKKELFEENGEVTYSVNIFVNDRPLKADEEASTELAEGDEILIFMPVGGG